MSDMDAWVIFLICACCFTAGFIIGAGIGASTTNTNNDED